MPEADLYLDRIDLFRYWPAKTEISCEDFVSRLVKEEKEGIHDYPFLTSRQLKTFEMVLKAGKYNWRMEAGPVCAAELPLFLGDRWIFAAGL